jgi:hypothetical protein
VGLHSLALSISRVHILSTLFNVVSLCLPEGREGNYNASVVTCTELSLEAFDIGRESGLSGLYRVVGLDRPSQVSHGS